MVRMSPEKISIDFVNMIVVFLREAKHSHVVIRNLVESRRD